MSLQVFRVCSTSIHYFKPKKDRCYICLEVFENYAALVDHIKIHTELLLTCPVCDKVFRQVDPATLHKNHLRVHTKETPYVCEKCNRGFSQVGNLKRHLALHVEKKINSEDDNSSDSNKEPPNKEPLNKEPPNKELFQ
ncbi:hypothetical protein CEXT_615461 [Caerostris extrusa]|uniref:C2H2-type domain-containing protein n=1 Tax=Caerostris extrusa TaxID=172846 RepID=A0AAV4TF29_CAEEX|nr:hypothetical protein CEXT_615461 [Caerostris extrusa]